MTSTLRPPKTAPAPNPALDAALEAIDALYHAFPKVEALQEKYVNAIFVAGLYEHAHYTAVPGPTFVEVLSCKTEVHNTRTALESAWIKGQVPKDQREALFDYLDAAANSIVQEHFEKHPRVTAPPAPQVTGVERELTLVPSEPPSRYGTNF